MFGIDDIISGVLQVINKVIPDPEKRAEIELEVLKQKQAGEFKEIDAALQQAQMQTDINKVEATNENVFISGWRPFIGWICGFAFGYHFIMQPFLSFILAALHRPVISLAFDMADLNTVLMGLLGLGTLRTVEKFKK